MMAAADYGSCMTLKSVLEGIAGGLDIPDIAVSGLKLDSRKIVSGDVFVALPGTRCHGMQFAEQALSKGAVGILFDPSAGGKKLADLLTGKGVRILVAIDSLDQKIGFLADRFYHRPSEYLLVIGVTGTDGKTSCSHFFSQSLAGERRCAVVGTLGWGCSEQLMAMDHTTPPAIELQSILATLRQQDVDVVAMEVSSHGLAQGRINGVRFTGALVTNISRDHLDYHGTFEAYVEAKLRILGAPGLEFVVINLDDSNYEKILEKTPKNVKIIGFSRFTGLDQRISNQVRASAVVLNEDGLSFTVEYGRSSESLSLPIYGDFNVDNVLATMACLIAIGYSLKQSKAMVAKVKAIPGRLERFASGVGSPSVIVDYAHTPQALERALVSVKQHCKGSLWLVFGCGGDRDRGKRPQMGRIAESLADYIVITDDNPRSEDGQMIVEQILEGCLRKDICVTRDREEAIYSVINQAESDDLVLVAGKGHETTQEVNGVKYPLSDRKVVREALLQKSKKNLVR